MMNHALFQHSQCGASRLTRRAARPDTDRPDHRSRYRCELAPWFLKYASPSPTLPREWNGNAASGSEGYYTAPLLPPGKYQVAVQKEGFRPVTRTGITLNVNQALQDRLHAGSRKRQRIGFDRKRKLHLFKPRTQQSTPSSKTSASSTFR